MDRYPHAKRALEIMISIFFLGIGVFSFIMLWRVFH